MASIRGLVALTAVALLAGQATLAEEYKAVSYAAKPSSGYVPTYAPKGEYAPKPAYGGGNSYSGHSNKDPTHVSKHLQKEAAKAAEKAAKKAKKQEEKLKHAAAKALKKESKGHEKNVYYAPKHAEAKPYYQPTMTQPVVTVTPVVVGVAAAPVGTAAQPQPVLVLPAPVATVVTSAVTTGKVVYSVPAPAPVKEQYKGHKKIDPPAAKGHSSKASAPVYTQKGGYVAPLPSYAYGH